jgi:LPS-assembly protein
VFALLCLCTLQTAHAQTSEKGIALSADRMARDLSTGLVTLEGKVQLVFGKNYLSAEKAVLNNNTKEVVAEGKVVLQNQEVYAEAERIEINYETKVGFLYEAFVQTGQVVFEGAVIEQKSETEFIATKATYTACKSCPPGWSFSGSKIEATVGGYADITYPVIRISGYPVFFLPRIIVPLKSTRQTGLLEPKLEIGSKSGLTVSQPHFWAISRSQDLTSTLKYYEKRGWKLLEEYRYVLAERSSGTLKGAMIEDRIFEDADLDNEEDFQRGFLDYKHFFTLGDRTIQRTKFTYMSDLRYPRDFSDEVIGHGDPAFENSLSLSHSTDNTLITGEVAAYQNLLQSDPLADNTNAVHRVPDIRLSSPVRRLFDSPLLFTADVNTTNFYRADFAYDDITEGSCASIRGQTPERCLQDIPDDEFDPTTDLMRTGQRLDVDTSLRTPFHLSGIEVEPVIGFRQASYFFPVDDLKAGEDFDKQVDQRFLSTQLSMRFPFSRIFNRPEPGSVVTNYSLVKHIFQPELHYSYLPWIERADHPFFGDFGGQAFEKSFDKVTDQDFFGNNKLQFDHKDRIFNQKLLRFVINNRFLRKKVIGDQNSYQNVGLVRIGQSYDFDELEKGGKTPWSSAIGEVSLRLDSFETNIQTSYYPYANVADVNSRMRYSFAAGYFSEISYVNELILNEERTEVPTFRNRTENIGFGSGITGKFISLEARVDYSSVTSKILSWQYLALLKPPGDCWGIELGQKQEIGSDETKLILNFSLLYGGA